MKILFTICGRAGSKGIKNKNIRSFLGRPLPYFTLSAIDLYLKRAQGQAEYDIVVNTDSPELIRIMQENPMRAVSVIERDPALGGDFVGKIDVIGDCLKQMEKRRGSSYDVVVDLDITSPLRRVEDIEKLIDTHFKTGADVTTTVAPARRNPYFNQVMKTEKGFKKVIDSNFTARQQAPEIFDMNASIYAYKPSYLFTGKGVLAGYCECIEMCDTGILDLDHENDFELLEVIAKYFYETRQEFGEIFENIKIKGA